MCPACPEAAGVSHDIQRTPTKRAHLRVLVFTNTIKNPREDPQERETKKSENGCGRGRNRREIWLGLSTLQAPLEGLLTGPPFGVLPVGPSCFWVRGPHFGPLSGNSTFGRLSLQSLWPDPDNPPEPAPHPTLKTKIWCFGLAKLGVAKVGVGQKKGLARLGKTRWPNFVLATPTRPIVDENF